MKQKSEREREEMTEGTNERRGPAVEAELSALLDEEVEASRADELRRRMEDDAELRRRFEAFARVDAALRAAPRPDRTEALRAGFEARLRAAEAPPPTTPGPQPVSGRQVRVRPLRRALWSQTGAASIAAAAAILLALWWFAVPDGLSPRQAPVRLAETDPPIVPEAREPSEARAPRPTPEAAEAIAEAPLDERASEAIAAARPAVTPAEPETPDGDAPALEQRVAERPQTESLIEQEGGSGRRVEAAPESIRIAERSTPSPQPTSDRDTQVAPAEAIAPTEATDAVLAAELEPTEEELAIALELDLLTDLPVIEYLELLEVAVRTRSEEDAG